MQYDMKKIKLNNANNANKMSRPGGRNSNRNRKTRKSNKKKVCFFCAEKISAVEYKDVDLLRRFTTAQSKIIARKRTGMCSKHQRRLSNAIKRARFMAIIPYVSR